MYYICWKAITSLIHTEYIYIKVTFVYIKIEVNVVVNPFAIQGTQIF